jgi:YjbE family integral membrane protein
MLQIPFLKLVGGILLLWIGYKLMVQEDEEEHNLNAPDKLFAAIKTIIIADIVMSLDNVLAIAGAAGQVDNTAHQIGYVIFGLIVSIPIIVAGSRIVLYLIDRFPIIVTAGAGLLGWIAGGMMVTDPALVKRFGEGLESYTTIAGIAGAIAVMALGEIMKRRAKASKAS